MDFGMKTNDSQSVKHSVSFFQGNWALLNSSYIRKLNKLMASVTLAGCVTSGFKLCVYLAVEPIRVLWGATGVTVFAPSEVSAAANTSVYQNWRVSFITEERITTLKTSSLLSTHDPTGDVIGWARDRRWEAGGSSNQLLNIIFTYTWTVWLCVKPSG